MINLLNTEYEALLTWARVGAEELEDETPFYALRKKIDVNNGISRYTLVIRYDQLPQQPTPGITQAPRGNTKTLELTRPPTPDDVIQALAGETFYPGLVYLTADPNGEVGWYNYEVFPWA
jgi:hypothetical protein